VSCDSFLRFFDTIESVFSYQLSIGQPNTLVLSPASTFHSELAETAQAKSGIYLTTMFTAMGADNE
jgi:O-acetylhomoserine/O-acetylserine sulfhydrylase-like pyridoxal-dependent enzyme